MGTKRLFFGLFFVVVLGSMVSAQDFAKVAPALGPSSFVLGPRIGVGLGGLDIGANFEWGIKDLPLTIGGAYSLGIFLGEAVARVGYHPDFGLDKWDIYANLSLGLINLYVLPFTGQIGGHIGARYFFKPKFAAQGEVGFARNGSILRLGVCWNLR